MMLQPNSAFTAPQRTSAVAHNYRAIFLDDDEDILSSINRLFFNEPFDILTSTCPETVMELIGKHDIKVVVSDYRMFGLCGVDFLRSVNKRYPDRVCILFTGYPDFNMLDKAVGRARIFRVLNRPWDGELLKRTITRALRHYEIMNHPRYRNDEDRRIDPA